MRPIVLLVLIAASGCASFRATPIRVVPVGAVGEIVERVVRTRAAEDGVRFGFLNGSRARTNLANLDTFLDSPRVEVLSCDEETALRYAELRLQLKRQGTPIPMNDIWIAALALQHGATLFTRDADFDHLPQLRRV